MRAGLGGSPSELFTLNCRYLFWRLRRCDVAVFWNRRGLKLETWALGGLGRDKRIVLLLVVHLT